MHGRTARTPSRLIHGRSTPSGLTPLARRRTPMHMTGKRRIATWTLAAASFASLSLLTTVGCDKLETSARQDDRKIDDSLAESNLKRETGGEKASDQALKALQTAASFTNASNTGKVRAKSELA